MKASLFVVMLVAGCAQAAVLQVGPGRTYATPCRAIAAAAANDTIEIDASGTYSGDVCGWTKNGLHIVGVNGRPKIDAAGANYGGKGTWVVSGNDTIIENVELTGATDSEHNGAAIRQEGTNLTMRRCYIHHNQNGILTAPNASSNILIEETEFAYNGYGDGYTHNIYIGQIAQFTMRYCYSHHSSVGHLVKSRAQKNLILYNRISDESTGTGSYEVDLPNAGLSYLIGNVIEQGPNTQNPSIVAYGEEGLVNSSSNLYVINNTIVNDRSGGGTFINVAGGSAAAVVKNNIFSGSGTLCSQSNAVMANNYSGGNAMFVNPAGYDYHLQSGSPAINAGADPGTGSGMTLAPDYQYVHPTCFETRTTNGSIDIGAFEYNGGGGADSGCTSTTTQPGTLSGLSLAPSSIAGGATSTGTVTLSSAAPANGVLVALYTTNNTAAPVPASILVPQGSSSATFPITAGTVSATTTATITASYGGVSKTSTLTVTVAAAPAALASLAVSSTTGTVTLTAAAPSSGAVVALSSSNAAAASVPASVTVRAGATSAQFPITDGTVSTNTNVTVTASYSGVSKTATLTVTAATAPAALASLAVSSTSGTVALTAAAPSSGAVVALNSSNAAAASVPASVTVRAGATSAQFPIPDQTVSTNTNVTVTASYSGVSKTATLTVTAATAPAALASLAVSSNAGTVSLTAAAPSGGAVVALGSSNTSAATVPASVTVPAGATSAQFSIAKQAVATSTTVTISATYQNVTKTATLTVSAASTGNVQLSGLRLAATYAKGGTTISGNTVILSGPAPSGGATVALRSSSTAASVPASVTVPAGATSATFAIRTTRSWSWYSWTAATISATYGGVTRSANIAVR